jgi:hypothetical protein
MSDAETVSLAIQTNNTCIMRLVNEWYSLVKSVYLYFC